MLENCLFQRDFIAQNKIFAHLDRVFEWLSTGRTMPIMIEIDPTNACNCNCPECAGNRANANAFLPLGFMKKIIRNVKPFCNSLVFTGGGEPLCNKGTVKAIEFAAKKGISVGLITNGLLLDGKKSESLLKNCEWIRVSVDASTPFEYQKIHGINGNNFATVWKNIELLNKTKKALKSGCTIGLGYLVAKSNKSGILPFTKRAKAIGVDYAQFRPFHYSSFFPANELKKAKKLETNSFRVLATMHRFDKKKGSFEQCFRDEFSTVINAEGKLYHCCFTRGIKEFCFGNLNKDSFEKIWNSKKRQEIEKNKLKSKNCPEMCKFDPLNKLLWEIYLANKEGKHLNFV